MPMRKDVNNDLKGVTAAVHQSTNGYKVIYTQFEVHLSTVRRTNKLKIFKTLAVFLEVDVPGTSP